MNKKISWLLLKKSPLVTSALAMALAGNIRAQNQQQISGPVTDKITHNITFENNLPYISTIAPESVQMVPGDGFIKVTYVIDYTTMDNEIIQLPRVELYDVNGNLLETAGATTIMAKDIKRIRTFPTKLQKYLSEYMILGLEMDEHGNTYTVYNAYDQYSNLVGYSPRSLEDLKNSIAAGKIARHRLGRNKNYHER